MNPGLHAGNLFFELGQVVVQTLQLLGRRSEPPPAPAGATARLAAGAVVVSMARACAAALPVTAMPMSVSVPMAVPMAASRYITHDAFLL
jgi:hypothetical protein